MARDRARSPEWETIAARSGAELVTPSRPLVGVGIAASMAVLLWASKPVLITLIESDAGFAEVYLLSAAISVAASFVLLLNPRIRAFFSLGTKMFGPLTNASIAGCFLALWYYGFYRALMEASPTDATVIGFSWPLIAVLSIRLIRPGTAAPLRVMQWALLIISFVGVAALSIRGASNLGSGLGNLEILWALAAALGSGCYLPFAMKASGSIQESLEESGPISTLISISLSNFIALIGTFLALLTLNQSLDFSGVTISVLGVCAIIGLGIYLVAEVAWTWAMSAGGSLTLAALPYFSPAISVILLAIFFGAPVTSFTLACIALILTANITMHFTNKQR